MTDKLFAIIPDPNFTATALDKQGLTESEYLLSEEEELPEASQEAPLYWRVKAVNGAGNESEWSPPQTFYTKTSFSIPGWVIYTLIAIFVIIVGYVAFRWGRRTAFDQPD